MLSEHISGDNFITPASRSSTAMVGDPPVVMLITASVDCLMRGRNCMNIAGSPVGRPAWGLRPCRSRMAGAAWAARMACSEIWSGVIGSASDMVGVWIAPVTAQVMMTLSDFAAIVLSRDCRILSGSGCAGIRGKAQAPLQRQELPAEALGEKAPDALRRQQHHGHGDGAQHEKIKAAEIGKRLPQNKKYDGADDRPLHPADAADNGDEDDEGAPVVRDEGGVGGNTQ